MGSLRSTPLIKPATSSSPWVRGFSGATQRSARPSVARRSADTACPRWCKRQPRRWAIVVLLSPAATNTALARATIACDSLRDAPTRTTLPALSVQHQLPPGVVQPPSASFCYSEMMPRMRVRIMPVNCDHDTSRDRIGLNRRPVKPRMIAGGRFSRDWFVRRARRKPLR